MLSLLPAALIQLEQQGIVRFHINTLVHLPHLTSIDVCVKQRKQDDELYAKTPNLKQYLPRGLCFIVNHETNQLVHTLSGLRKFTYDDQLTDEQRAAQVKQWLFATKENGECFHFTAFEDPVCGTCIVAGSKNVHGVFRMQSEDVFQQDLKLYAAEKRYGFCCAMLQHFMQVKTHTELMHTVIPYLLQSQETICFESCRLDSLHLVSYAQSQVFAFALTRYDACWTSTAPLAARQLFEQWQIPSVQEAIVVPADDLEQLTSVRAYFYTLNNSEGAVVYALDANGQTITVFKWKNFQYMFWRSVREKLKRGHQCTAAQLKSRLSVNNYHAQHPDGVESHQKLVEEALDFRAWYLCNIHNTAQDETAEYQEDNWVSSSQWVKARNTFNSLSIEERCVFRELNLTQEQSTRSKGGDQLLLISIAPPGAGKSSLLRSYCAAINGCTAGAAVYLDQDMCQSKATVYHQKIRQLTDVPKNKRVPPVLALGKSHGTHQTRGSMRNAIVTPQQLVYVVFHHSDDASGTWGRHMQAKCLERIRQRGAHHLTLCDDNPKLEEIIAGWMTSYEPLAQDEMDDASLVVYVDVKCKTLEQQVQELIFQLHPFMRPEWIEYCNTPSSVSNAIQSSLTTEAGLKHNATAKSRKVRYWCIELTPLSVATLTQVCAEHKIDVDPQLHVTLYFPKMVESEKNNALEQVLNQCVQVKVQRLIGDASAVAAEVELPDHIPFYGEHPHITLRTSHGIRPVYCGTMFASDHQLQWQHECQDFIVQGFVTKVFT